MFYKHRPDSHCDPGRFYYVYAMDKALNQLEGQIGYTFKNRERLLEALVHPSFAAEHRETSSHNQRLEFLGDAVLQVVATRLLFDAFPGWPEGKLSKLRAAICKEGSLVKLARSIDLGDHLRMGRGETQSGGAERASNLADAFEAVLGAMYLDGGLPPVETFLQQKLAPVIMGSEDLLKKENAKGALQELTQQLYQTTPVYKILAVEGPDHSPCFSVAIELQGEHLATCQGPTRKSAEKAAALAALELLRQRNHAGASSPTSSSTVTD